MNNVVGSLVQHVKRAVRIAVKRRWAALLAASVVLAVCFAAVSMHPERYQASARIYVDTQSVLKPLMAEITFQPDINQQVNMLARTLISRPNVEQLVSLPRLGIDPGSPEARERLVTRLMSDIKVTPAGGGNLYDITYRGPTPEQAQRLVQVTVEMFVFAGSGAKKRDSQDAGRFIQEQIGTYEAKLTEAENRLKDFKVRNFGVSGVSNQDYFTRVSTLSDEVSKLRVDLSAAEQSRDSYRRELSNEEPQLPADPTLRAGSLAAEQDARLQAQKKVLDELLRRFTDEHPDVTSARRTVAQLEAELRETKQAEAAALARGGKSARAATSPVYQKLRISLAEAEAQVASLRSQLGAKQATLEENRAAASRAPQVEAELVQLNRDYDIIRKNYDLMVARRESASLGLKLDESSQLAEFRVVEPPRVSNAPVFPSKLALGLIAVVLSLVAGATVAAVAESAWPTLDDKKALQEFSRRPVLGSVSMLVTPEGASRRRKDHVRYAGAVGVLMLLQVAWIAWLALNFKSQ